MNIRNRNYLDLPPQYTARERAAVAIIPVPFDKTSTWKKGARFGPRAIIKASAHLEHYDLETDSEAFRRGIHTHRQRLKFHCVEKMVQAVESVVSAYLEEKKLPIVIGGEHSVTIGAVYAAVNKRKQCGVLQLDAHSDFRHIYGGSRFNHACVMARVAEKCPVVQVGIRSMDASEKARIDPERIFLARDIYAHDNWIDAVLMKLPEEVYITIDLDVFDPALVPSTGTPEPGGLSWYRVTTLLKSVFKQKKVIGCDVVELCPGPDHSSDFLAAKLIYKLISYYTYYT